MVRVMNEDRLVPCRRMPTRPDREAWIFSDLLLGALGPRESVGTGQANHSAQMQPKSAWTGVRQSRATARQTVPAHVLQLSNMPERHGTAPSSKRRFLPRASPGETRLDRIGAPINGEHAMFGDQKRESCLALVGEDRPLSDLHDPFVHVRAEIVRELPELLDGELRTGDRFSCPCMTSNTLNSHARAQVLIFDLAKLPINHGEGRCPIKT